jgi:hypothetical protein
VVNYFAGLDLGQVTEYSALAVLGQERAIGQTTYAVRHLQRWQPGRSYHAIAADVREMLRARELGCCSLMIDRTGVGHAVAALFAEAAISVRSLIVSAGHAESRADDGSLLVPKMELVAVLQLLLQGRRFRVSSQLPLAETLVREMECFKAKVTPAGASEILDWREREHDDLVLAVAIAAWDGEQNHADPGEPIVFDDLPSGPAWRW